MTYCDFNACDHCKLGRGWIYYAHGRMMLGRDWSTAVERILRKSLWILFPDAIPMIILLQDKRDFAYVFHITNQLMLRLSDYLSNAKLIKPLETETFPTNHCRLIQRD
jgi:hypothetical protein